MGRPRKNTVATATSAAPTPLDVQAAKPVAKLQPFIAAPPAQEATAEEKKQAVVVEPGAQAAIEASKTATAVAIEKETQKAAQGQATESLEASVLAELKEEEAPDAVSAASEQEKQPAATVEPVVEAAAAESTVEQAVYSKAEASEIAQKAVRRALTSKKVRGLQEENERLKAELRAMRRGEELDSIAKETGVSRALLEQSRLEGEDLQNYAVALKAELAAYSSRQQEAATSAAGSLLRSTVVAQTGKMDGWARLAADLAR